MKLQHYYIIFCLGLIPLVFGACDDDAEGSKSGHFIKYYGNQYANEGIKVIQDDDQGYIILANYFDINDKNILLLKTDKFGNELWRSFIGEDSINNNAADFYMDSDRSFVILGTTTIQTGINQVMVVKLNSNREEVWRSVVGDPTASEVPKSIIPDGDGGSVITGYCAKENNNDLIYMQVSDIGDSIIYRTYSKDSNAEGNSIIATSGKDFFIITGTQNVQFEQSTETKTCLFKLNKLGGGIDNKFTFNQTGEIANYGIQSYLDHEENLFVLSNTFNSDGTTNINFVKFTSGFSSNNDTSYSKTFSKDQSIYAYSFAPLLNENGFAIIGYIEEQINTIYLLKINDEGSILLEKNIGGFEEMKGASIQQTSDGGFIILGTIGTETNADICLIKTNAEGFLKD